MINRALAIIILGLIATIGFLNADKATVGVSTDGGAFDEIRHAMGWKKYDDRPE